MKLKTIGSSKIIISGVPQMHREKIQMMCQSEEKSCLLQFLLMAWVWLMSQQIQLALEFLMEYFVPLGVSQKYSFDTGEEKIGTYQFLDSVGEALGWEAFPYPTTPHEHMPISYIPGQGGSEQDACTQWLGIK